MGIAKVGLISFAASAASSAFIVNLPPTGNSATNSFPDCLYPRFTMNAEEAAEAAKLIKPSLAIPMHYGSIVGSDEDAQEFKELCEENNIKVKILEKE